MHCEIFETLYIKANGEIPCNDDAGENVILDQIPLETGAFSPRAFYQGERMQSIRSAFLKESYPWENICNQCALFRQHEIPDDGFGSRIRKVQLEPSLYCNLRCAGCCNMTQRKTKAHPLNMPPSSYRQILSGILNDGYSVGTIEYCGQGEPLMHPHFSGLVDISREVMPRTRQRLFTNANFDFKEKIGNCFLDEIFISCEGITQHSYEQYRQNGNLKQVLKFIRNAVRSGSGNRRRYVVWKYILFEWNDTEKELIKAQKVAEDIGVDTLLFVFTHSRGKSVRFTPESIHELPVVSGIVVTNHTPILENRKMNYCEPLHLERYTTSKEDLFFLDEISLVDQRMVILRGWHLTSLRKEGLYVSFEGGAPIEISNRQYRPEVRSAYPRFRQPHAGFMTKLSPPHELSGVHQLDFYRIRNGVRTKIASCEFDSTKVAYKGE